jgi:hypothetical protein
MSPRLEEAESGDQAQNGNDGIGLVLTVLTGTAITTAWIGFLVWLPLRIER